MRIYLLSVKEDANTKLLGAVFTRKLCRCYYYGNSPCIWILIVE